jgi:hypothetical protein
MDHLVKAERRNRFTEVRPSGFALVRVCLEMFFVSQRKPRQRTAVLEAGDRVTNDERLLLCRIECARDDAVCDIIAWNDIENRRGADSRNLEVSCAKERDESRVCCVTVDSYRLGQSSAVLFKTRCEQCERNVCETLI